MAQEEQEVDLAIKSDVPEQTETEPTQEETTEEVKYSEVELRAMEQGWKPLDQWEGDPAEHRSAREYLDRGELLGVIKATKGELRELKNALRYMSEHQRKVHQSAYEQALSDLRKQKVDAIERGDGQKVVELDDRIQEHQQAIQTIRRAPAPVSEQDVSPTFENWLTRNQWYQTDPAKQAWANELAVSFGRTKKAAGEPVQEQELYDYITKEYRRIFVEPLRAKAPPAPDGGSKTAGAKATVTANASPESRLKTITAGLDPEDRRAVEKMIREGFVTVEQFVKDFEVVNKRGR